ncbi:uncharacterized protein TNCV_1531751 [Trichonephila clavipes]|nr:uncharacterized protein TNCV_1531751 [Trichonephila clavipes]
MRDLEEMPGRCVGHPICQGRSGQDRQRAILRYSVGKKMPQNVEDREQSLAISAAILMASSIHWCAKIKDEVEKLAYQLNEEAERTERPIRRLSKVMYGSTCADMQVDVMGECLSSITHVVGVRSVFLAKRLHAV